MKSKALSIFFVCLLSACASVPEQTAENKSKLPDWVMMPIIEDGFADSQCVSATADMNLLKTKAIALARAEIAKQLDLSVKAMDKSYQNLTDTSQGSSLGSTFESVSKQVTQAQLNGSRAVKMEYVEFPDNTQKLCVMVTLSPAVSKSLFDNLIKESNKNLSPTNEEVLYQQFLAKKAQDEMDFELEKNNQ